MEQNPLSDEQLLKRIAEVLNKSEKNVKLEMNSENMQKHRPKTVHTAPTSGTGENKDNPEKSSEPQDLKKQKSSSDEITFRDAEDFKSLEEGLEIIKDEKAEAEKVYITKTERRCFEDIGNLASRTRTPIDEKHQRYFERDRKKLSNKITMPETQEIDKTESVPPEIISKTKETPVNITSTELDGLRSYLLQLKELIARRETAWARTTERDYNQRVEISKFKNEVSHLRMLSDRRQREIKEKDQIIATKDEEIKELQKKIYGLKNALAKFEKKENNFTEGQEGNEEKMILKTYDAMKKSKSISLGKDSTRRPSRKSKRNEDEEGKKTTKTPAKMMDEKFQKIEEILKSEALKNKKTNWRPGKTQSELKNLMKNQNVGELDPNFQKKMAPNTIKMRQETILGAMGGFKLLDAKKPDLGNSFLAARNAHIFNY